MLCDFMVWIAEKLFYLFSYILPSAPSTYLNAIDNLKITLNSFSGYLFFLDIQYLITLFTAFIEITITIIFIFFIYKIIKLIRG